MSAPIDILNKVNEIVSPTYLVGGAVRDHVLGVEACDYDFATPLLPDEVEERVRAYGRRPHRAGKRFGTIGFRLDGNLVEVTTFRSEVYSEGNRKPTVTFARNIVEDLSRRDFTINAMAMRPDGRLIDPFDGRHDVFRGIIKAVGNPTVRFKEDPLRLLRAARVASQLGFVFDPDTVYRGRRRAHRILQVSRERWVMEMDKLLLGTHVKWGLQALHLFDILRFMLPELALQVGYDQQTPYHDWELWEHTKASLAAAPADIELRWALLLHDIGKPFVAVHNGKTFLRDGKRIEQLNYMKHDLVGAEIVKRLASYLRWSNERRELVVGLVLGHLAEDSPLRVFDSTSQKRVDDLATEE
jgi:tRNA nucleotidyltransferase/poly(A) polymerase